VPDACHQNDGGLVDRADHPLASYKRITLAQIDGSDVVWPSRRDPYFEYYRDLFSRNRLNCRHALQSPFANFSIRMSGVLNALSFNNALIASIVCRSDETLTWRPVDGIDAKTTFYLSFPDVLHGTETQVLVQNGFTAVTEEAVTDLGWLNAG
jgi:hypothetical protein